MMTPGIASNTAAKGRVKSRLIAADRFCAVSDPATAVLTWLMSPGAGEQLPSLEEVLRRPGWMELAAWNYQTRPIDVRHLETACPAI